MASGTIIVEVRSRFWDTTIRGNDMQRPLQVGIIGASADRGWARDSHVPAVQNLRGLELGGVASGNQAKSDAAAKAFGAPTAYANSQELIQDPRIDIVSVCVKVPDHRDLVLSAISAGKHIYCEWPLGRNLAETEELAAAATGAGLHVAIGLQTRCNPELQQARRLLESGAIGTVLSARIVSSTIAFGKTTGAPMAFSEDPANGVTLVTIQGAHTIDAAIAVLGGLDFASALTSTQYPQIEVGDPPTPYQRITPDHILVQAQLKKAGVLAIEVAGGRPADQVPFSFQITGTNGEIELHGGAIRGFQSGTLQLLLNGERQTADKGELSSMPDIVLNVAGVYAGLRDDINSGTYNIPDFQHAVRLHRLIDDLSPSAKGGLRKSDNNWPVR